MSHNIYLLFYFINILICSRSSDSEFESIASISNTATGTKANKEKRQKRKPDASGIDSEVEFEETTKQKKVKKTPKPKSNRTPSTAAPNKKVSKNGNPFELFPEDEDLEASSASLLDSSIVQRVANGLTKRTLELDGKLYHSLTDRPIIKTLRHF
ncbi:uncharacterized protein LOC133534092 [Cydia pomonella]|uniref:uncharacterized protein LOC133534092 n=1 Tax=Cydia pomonella TaxID=82600 RepID=UPI002ADE10C0|nr:uncharacterized protein LOC133534092 [Cydia pomonella]